MFKESTIITDIKTVTAHEFVDAVSTWEKPIEAFYFASLEDYRSLESLSTVSLSDLVKVMSFTDPSPTACIALCVTSTRPNLQFIMTTATDDGKKTAPIIKENVTSRFCIFLPVPAIPDGIGIRARYFDNTMELLVNPYSASYPSNPF